MSAAPPRIEADRLTVRYGRIRALDEISLRIEGRATGLLGPNGAGKSTFLKTILGLLRPDEGRATVLGVDVGTGRAAVRRRVGYMPERDCHLPQLTAVDTVALCGELSGMPRNRAFQRAHEVLNYVGLSEMRYRAVDGFSAGSRQRCKLACALVHDPDLLVLDEPTNGLDPAGRTDFLALLREVNSSGIALLLSTHLLPDVKEVCEDVVVIGHGRSLRSGSVAALTRDLEAARTVRVHGVAGDLVGELRRRAADVTVDEATGELRVILPAGADNRLIFGAAAAVRVGLQMVAPASRTLEAVFLESLARPAGGEGETDRADS
jgi:ABC-2 type transport system ATP-binding protein